jgi:hypothetical protein
VARSADPGISAEELVTNGSNREHARLQGERPRGLAAEQRREPVRAPPGSAPEPSRCRDDMADHAAEPVSRRMRHHGSLLPVTDRLGQLPRKSGADDPVHSRPPGGISDRLDPASIRSAAHVASAAPREDSQPPNTQRSHNVTIRLCDCGLDCQACSREPRRIRDAYRSTMSPQRVAAGSVPGRRPRRTRQARLHRRRLQAEHRMVRGHHLHPNLGGLALRFSGCTRCYQTQTRRSAGYGPHDRPGARV